MMLTKVRAMTIVPLCAGAALVCLASTASAQGNRYYEQTYLAGSHSYAFNDAFPGASRLFNAFDYGHAIIYEKLWRTPQTAARELEGREYDFITKKLLVKPPRVPLDESAIGPEWSLLAPETLEMFHWAHLLHRQLYDVLAHDLGKPAERDAHVAELLRYYRSRPAVAFSSTPKNMALMEGQSYSLAFRKQNPKFNGLLWSYHWAQMTLYDALLSADTRADQDVNVDAVVKRFFEMVNGAPGTLPTMMPMTPAIAPIFTERYPEAGIIFDNLHSLHDVVSDILTNPNVPRDRKREMILVASGKYRDATSNITTVAEWKAMANGMGLDEQGGPAPLPRRPAVKPVITPNNNH